MSWRLRLFYFLFIVLGLPTQALAQNEPGRFQFEHISINEGLSHSDAMAVTQDIQGFIWIGTNKGINRYDGYSLKKYSLPLNRLTGLSSNRIRVLHVSQDSSLWAGAERAGLFWLNNQKDEFIPIHEFECPAVYRPLVDLLAKSNVSSMVSDTQGTLWIGTSESLFVLKTNRSGHILFLEQINLSNPVKNQSYPIRKLAIDKQGTVWIGTVEGGLWSINGKKSNDNTYASRATKVGGFPTASIQALHIDRHGNLWIGTLNQIFWVNARMLAQTLPFQAQPLGQKFADIQSICLDSYDRLWIGTNAGLRLLGSKLAGDSKPPVEEENARIFLPDDTDPFSINSVWVHDILEDRFHNLWIATPAGGLNQLRLQAKPFAHLRLQLSQQTIIANNYISALYKDDKTNQLWIGTRNGLASYDFTQKATRTYLNQPLPTDRNAVVVSALFKASTGVLWIGTRNYGVYLSHETPMTTGLSKLPHMPGRPWTNMSIECITEDRFGTIWVATSGTGLHRFSLSGRYLGSYTMQNRGLPTNQLTALLYDRAQDLLWASTKNAGLLKLRIGPDTLNVVRQFSYNAQNSNSLSSNFTWPLVKGQQGELWIGTIGGGLNCLFTNKSGQEVIQRFSEWIPETDVESILLDKAGNAWIGGDGLYQFNPATKRVFHYTVSDGLQSNSFKVGAAYQAPDGSMFFGGINGITYFQPSTIKPNPTPPTMQLIGLRVMNQSVSVGDTLNGRVLLMKPLSVSQTVWIKPSENDFSIEFVGLNFANPQQNQYAYQLVGYNEDWVQPAPGQRLASFANLPSGEYTFRVKGRNDQGVWSVPLATFQLVILPPWWKTWWAFLLYGVTIIGGLLLYRRVEMAQQELKSKLALEQFKVEKEKELTDLKLRFFTNVSHELRTPLTLILGPLEELASVSGNTLHNAKDKLVLMHRQTRKLFELVNQLLDFRKVESGHLALRASEGNVINFITEIFLIFKLKAEEQHLDYTLDVPDAAVPLFFDPAKLEVILTNLLSNAFKYSPEGAKIKLSAVVMGTFTKAAVFNGTKLSDNYLEIRVRDWGVGMEKEEVDKIFDPYYQASHTETLRMIGTGIGLSLVKQFVERHKGKISVHSEVGSGSTFILKLPFGRDHLSPEDIRPEPVQNLSIPGLEGGDEAIQEFLPTGIMLPASQRILLVEDNEDVRQYLQQLFEPNFEVFVAKDGVEGWEKALQLLPDLVVSDVMMPRSDGLELCRKIKMHAKTLHIPVVLLTARTAAIHELEGLETGADDYMAKPFNPKLLQAKVATILQNRYKLQEYYKRQILLEPTDVEISDPDRVFLETAMKFVEANLTNPEFNVPQLVEEMAMSQSVFYRRLKQITGQSVIEFIRNVRLKRAAYLLKNTTLRITEVSMLVGFDDSKHFSKTFHKQFSMSPSEYCKQHREVEKAAN